jgi:aspartyl/asparaginyl beta-hydroxylase (cupin superfamily)
MDPAGQTLSLRFFYEESEVYESAEPAFYDAEAIPAVREVLANYEMIRAELADYVAGAFTITPVNPHPPPTNAARMWQNVYFKNYLLPYRSGKKHFPRTYALFAGRDDITLAGVVSLAPGGKVMSHCGETNALIRCHLGLKIPGTLPDLGLRVKGQSVCWEEGKVIAFNDAYQHEVWNCTSGTRHILAFDVLRPEFRARRNEICANSLGIQAMQWLLRRLHLEGRLPRSLQSAIAHAFGWGFRAYLAVATRGR